MKPATGFDGQPGGPANQPVVPAYVKFVPPGRLSAPQRAHDKVLLGLRQSVLPFTMLGWPVAAGWSHLIDSPNYGTNSTAYAQRLGAAAAGSVSKEIFSDSILAPAFHQDPRYYQYGKSHSVASRAIYAATRTIVGRTDAGAPIPNFAYILGTGGAAALAQTYYPERNQTGPKVMERWGTSLGASAIGYVVAEFRGDILGWLHVRKDE